MSSLTSNEPLFISIEGNIGSGKSTLLTNLQNYIESNPTKYSPHSIVFLKEPVDLWETIIDPETGKNILELYYENQSKYAFQFQTLVFASQKQMMNETMKLYPNCRVIISERSIDAGINVFAKMLETDGILSPVEMQIYNLIIQNTDYKKLDAVIYLKIEPDVCIERINKRNRGGENNIEPEYIKKCEIFYDKWLCNKKEGEVGVSTITIKDNDLNTVLPILKKLIL
jgi:deoxyadenosine/deoxycytidine kinase